MGLLNPGGKTLVVLTFMPGHLLSSREKVLLSADRHEYVSVGQSRVDRSDIGDEYGCTDKAEDDEDDCLFRLDVRSKVLHIN